MSTSLLTLFTQAKSDIQRMIDNGSGGYFEAKLSLDALVNAAQKADDDVREAIEELKDNFDEYCLYVDSYEEADDDYHNAEEEHEIEEFEQLWSVRLNEVATAKSELDDALTQAAETLNA